MNIPQNFHQLYHNMNPDIHISLAKPNKQIIGNLSEAFNVSGNFKLGQINELSLSIPYFIENNFIQVRNKNVDKIKQRYLLKVKYLGIEEWFRIEEETDDLNDTNIKHVKAYSLGYQLSDKYIRQWAGYLTTYVDDEGVNQQDYRKDSLNTEQVMSVILDETSWNYNASKSDGIFLTRYRAFDFSGVNKLQAVITIADTMNAIIEWDTHSKEIIFHDAENYGSFRGLNISDDKYLSSYEKVTKSDELATRLKLYGKDGLTINEINPIGTDYIEDLSYFLKGFNMDSSGKVISHSHYVSDDLCKAIIEYQKNVENKNGQFTSLLSQKTNLELTLKEKQSELFELNNELTAIEVEIDFAESQQLSSSTWKSQQLSKKSQITSKQNEINTLNQNIETIVSEMNLLKREISIESNFTESQIFELDDYIVEKTWENENIFDIQELLELGRKELDMMNKPSSTYNIELIYLLRVAEAQKDVKKLILGDRIKIYKREINETVEAQLIEMNIDFDERNISLTIADFSTNKDVDELANLLYKNSIATNTINLNKSKWDDISNVGNFVNQILNESWDSAKREITSGARQSVISDNRGITTIDMVNPNKFVRIMGGVIGMTSNGGQTFKTAITGDKIVAEQIQGRLIVGQNMYMENEAGRFTFNNNGVTIKNTSFSLISESGGNGVSITAGKGLIVEKSDAKVRSTFNATDGILIETKKAGNWNKEFWYDPVGERLVVDGEINARELKINGQKVLTENNSRIDGMYVVNLNADNINAGKIKAQYIETKGLTSEEVKVFTDNGTVGLEVSEDFMSGTGAYIKWNSYDGKHMGTIHQNGGYSLDIYVPNTVQNGLVVRSANGMKLNGEQVATQNWITESYVTYENLFMYNYASKDWVNERINDVITSHINAYH